LPKRALCELVIVSLGGDRIVEALYSTLDDALRDFR
jgi:hypothetical protein